MKKSIENKFTIPPGVANGTILEKRKSAVNGSLEVCFQNGRLLLHSENANYSYDTLHLVFRKTFRHFNLQNRPIGRVLVLGFGAGSVASILVDELEQEVKITGVEADAVVIELARKYFNIDRFTNLNLVHDDAEEFVGQHNEKYDLIVSDIFIDKHVPEYFLTKEYIKALENLTARKGIGFYNYILEDKAQWREFDQLLQAFSKSVHLKIFSPAAFNRIIAWEKN
jgi:spermidine synthase